MDRDKCRSCAYFTPAPTQVSLVRKVERAGMSTITHLSVKLQIQNINFRQTRIFSYPGEVAFASYLPLERTL